MWKDFFTTLAAVLLGGGGLGYYFRDRWTHKLSKELEEFKTSLAADLFERQTRYVWLHTERAKALVEIYRHLKRTHAAFNLLLMPIQMDAGEEAEIERVQKATGAAIDLFGFFRENEVFFDDGLVGQLGNLQDEYRKLLAPILAKRAVPEGLKLADAWNKLGSLDPLLNDLKKTIQKMLDVG